MVAAVAVDTNVVVSTVMVVEVVDGAVVAVLTSRGRGCDGLGVAAGVMIALVLVVVWS